jgi:hypothetical protein
MWTSPSFSGALRSDQLSPSTGQWYIDVKVEKYHDVLVQLVYELRRVRELAAVGELQVGILHPRHQRGRTDGVPPAQHFVRVLLGRYESRMPTQHDVQ